MTDQSRQSNADREVEVETAIEETLTVLDNDFAKDLDRIATALEGIDFTLKQISKKLR